MALAAYVAENGLVVHQWGERPLFLKILCPSVGECQGQQERGSRVETPLPDLMVAEPQSEYGAELFEQYQREHGKEKVQAAEKVVTQEVEKSR